MRASTKSNAVSYTRVKLWRQLHKTLKTEQIKNAALAFSVNLWKIEGMSKPTQLDYLNRALAQAGEVSSIAYVCGVTPSAIYEWRRNCIPARHVKTLCAMKGVTVTPNQLRPDVF